MFIEKITGKNVLFPLEHFDNNVYVTISLLIAMRVNNVKTLVFSSSATVYEEPQYLPVDKNHPTRASNSYGRTKLHLEEPLQDVSISDGCWRIVCLRY